MRKPSTPMLSQLPTAPCGVQPFTPATANTPQAAKYFIVFISNWFVVVLREGYTFSVIIFVYARALKVIFDQYWVFPTVRRYFCYVIICYFIIISAQHTIAIFVYCTTHKMCVCVYVLTWKSVFICNLYVLTRNILIENKHQFPGITDIPTLN